MESKSGHIYYIDHLKAIGLCAIIIAHIAPPNIILQLRNFDVILMVICSGVLANSNGKRITKGYKAYFVSRVKRLIIPTWIFLVIYFTFSFLIGQRQNGRVILNTFLFQQTGIGYTWIILVYLICAFSLPIVSRIIPNCKGLLLWGVLLLLQELVCKCEVLSSQPYLESICCYIIPYVFAYWVGYWFDKMNKQVRCGIVGGSFGILILYLVLIIGGDNSALEISIYKYPPRLYYLCYGIFISGMLVYVYKKINNSKESILTAFISKWSLWIYLWHIIPVKIAERLFIGNNLWLVRLTFVLVGTSVIMMCHSSFVKILKKHYGEKNEVLKYLKG